MPGNLRTINTPAAQTKSCFREIVQLLKPTDLPFKMKGMLLKSSPPLPDLCFPDTCSCTTFTSDGIIASQAQQGHLAQGGIKVTSSKSRRCFAIELSLKQHLKKAIGGNLL